MTKRLSFLPFEHVVYDSTRHPGIPIEVVSAPQLIFAPHYLFIDGPDADKLMVRDICIGSWRNGAAVGDTPARVFELRGLASTMADLRTFMDEMSKRERERAPDPEWMRGRGAPHFEIAITVDEAMGWPLRLDLPPIQPGLLVRVSLDTRRLHAEIFPPWTRSVTMAMAGEIVRDAPTPYRAWARNRFAGDEEIEKILGAGDGDE